MENKFRRDLLESIRNNEFNEELFLTMAYDIVTENGLKPYVPNIELAKLDKKDAGVYHPLVGIKVNSERNNYIDTLDYYFKLFCSFHHELQHADQHKLLDFRIKKRYTEAEKKILFRLGIISCSLNYRITNPKGYYKYHDLIPSEHEANYYALFNTVKYLKEIIPEGKGLEDYKNTLFLRLISGYEYNETCTKIISPIEKSILDTMPDEIRKAVYCKDVFTDEERMILGLPVTFEQTKKVLSKYKD